MSMVTISGVVTVILTVRMELSAESSTVWRAEPGVGDAGDDEEVVVLEKGVVIALAGVFQDLGSGFLQELSRAV